MTTLAEVRLWGRTIGAVSLEENGQTAAFEYDPLFARSGIEISPLVMPLSTQVYRFPELPFNTFHGLPGLLADSLPDRFGNALINSWLAAQGRTPDSFNAVERLCYTGRRGMGALEFRPMTGPTARKANPIEIDRLVELASEVLTQRTQLDTSFGRSEEEHAMRDILRVGTSAGGARAKAVSGGCSADHGRGGIAARGPAGSGKAVGEKRYCTSSKPCWALSAVLIASSNRSKASSTGC